MAKAGHDVRFLMRRDLEAVRLRGLTVESCDGNFRLEKVQAFGDSREIGQVDLVICSLKTTSLDDAEKLIRPCVGPTTEILCLMNGFNIEDNQKGEETFLIKTGGSTGAGSPSRIPLGP